MFRADEGIQIYGGMDSQKIHNGKCLGDARIARIYEGTNRNQQNAICRDQKKQ
jgi:alkylation response protein AidB-like acyl-CoA dehydrogenase